MKIGIVSDTHDNLDLAREASEIFDHKVRKVIHCGDMVSPFTAKIFNKNYDFYCVRGNNDGEWKLKETVEEFGDFMGDQSVLEFSGAKIAVYHGTDEEIVSSLVDSENYDYVFRGHTHRKKHETNNGTVEINPGGIPIPGAEKDFHVAILDIESGDLDFIKVSED